MKKISFIVVIALAVSVVQSIMAVPIGSWPGPVFPPPPVIIINSGEGSANANLLWDGAFFDDATLKHMLGDLLPVYDPTEHQRQKPVKADNRHGFPPWMITAPMNSLEVPFDNVD